MYIGDLNSEHLNSGNKTFTGSLFKFRFQVVIYCNILNSVFGESGRQAGVVASGGELKSFKRHFLLKERGWQWPAPFPLSLRSALTLTPINITSCQVQWNWASESGPVFKWWSEYLSFNQMVIWIPNYHGTGHLNSKPFDDWTNPPDLNTKLVC